MDISKGINLIKLCEGCRLTSYKDAHGLWAIGYGYTNGINPGMTISQFDADNLLGTEANRLANEIVNLLGFTPSDNELSALVSLVYNIGVEAFTMSTMLRLMKNGASKDKVAQEFLKWDKSQGQVINGLENRRQAEMKLFLS